MRFNFQKLALIGSLTAMLSAAALAGQKDTKAKPNPPAGPQAKTPQPATHFTQGTITSIEANQMVITKKVRGKAQQVTFAMSSQTERTGNLVAGSRVSVQYREDDKQNIAAAVRELQADGAAKPGKAARKPRSKS